MERLTIKGMKDTYVNAGVGVLVDLTGKYMPKRKVGISELCCKLGLFEDKEQDLGIDLIPLLNAESIYIAMFSYWRWNLKDKQQCKKEDIGAIEEKQIKKERNFYIDFINKEIVIIKCDADYNYDIRITKLKFEDYGKTWSVKREELE